MAQMADVGQAEVAWQHLTSQWGDNLVPVTYQNSYATLKAFCGQRGGAVCTSANAQAIFRWALKEKGHLLFFPDEHLGRNSALAIGIPAEKIVVWNPSDPGASRAAARDRGGIRRRRRCRRTAGSEVAGASPGGSGRGSA